MSGLWPGKQEGPTAESWLRATPYLALGEGMGTFGPCLYLGVIAWIISNSCLQPLCSCQVLLE